MKYHVFRCWHVWKVIGQETLPSGIEQMGADAREIECGGALMLRMVHKPCIVMSRCEKCGSEKVERV